MSDKKDREYVCGNCGSGNNEKLERVFKEDKRTGYIWVCKKCVKEIEEYNERRANRK